MIEINRKITAGMLKEMKNRYKSGESGHMIAREFGIHYSTVYDCLRRIGVKIRSVKEAGILASEKDRIPIKHMNIRIFKNVNKRESIYFGRYVRGWVFASYKE